MPSAVLPCLSLPTKPLMLGQPETREDTEGLSDLPWSCQPQQAREPGSPRCASPAALPPDGTRRGNMKHGEPVLAGRAASVVHSTRGLSRVQDTGPPFSSQPAEPGMARCLCSGMGGLLPIAHPDGGIQLKGKFSFQGRGEHWHQALPGSVGTVQLLTNTGCSTLPFPWDAEQLPCTRRALLLPPGPHRAPKHPRKVRTKLLAPESWQEGRSSPGLCSILSLTLALGTSPSVWVTCKADAYQQLPVLAHRWGRACTRCYQTVWVMSGEHRRASC